MDTTNTYSDPLSDEEKKKKKAADLTKWINDGAGQRGGSNDGSPDETAPPETDVATAVPTVSIPPDNGDSLDSFDTPESLPPDAAMGRDEAMNFLGRSSDPSWIHNLPQSNQIAYHTNPQDHAALNYMDRFASTPASYPAPPPGVSNAVATPPGPTGIADAHAMTPMQIQEQHNLQQRQNIVQQMNTPGAPAPSATLATPDQRAQLGTQNFDYSGFLTPQQVQQARGHNYLNGSPPITGHVQPGAPVQTPYQHAAQQDRENAPLPPPGIAPTQGRHEGENAEDYYRRISGLPTTAQTNATRAKHQQQAEASAQAQGNAYYSPNAVEERQQKRAQLRDNIRAARQRNVPLSTILQEQDQAAAFKQQQDAMARAQQAALRERAGEHARPFGWGGSGLYIPGEGVIREPIAPQHPGPPPGSLTDKENLRATFLQDQIKDLGTKIDAAHEAMNNAKIIMESKDSTDDDRKNFYQKQMELQWLQSQQGKVNDEFNQLAPPPTGVSSQNPPLTQSPADTNTPAPATKPKTLTAGIAQQFLKQASGDKEKARELAKQQGYTF